MQKYVILHNKQKSMLNFTDDDFNDEILKYSRKEITRSISSYITIYRKEICKKSSRNTIARNSINFGACVISV